MITLETSAGVIKIELDHEGTPATAKNFEKHVESGGYDGTIFHRVIANFMVQGGGFTKDMSQKEGKETIENEANKGGKNVMGSLAMARTSDPHSASSQFFINVKDNDFLNFKDESTQGWGYCVFGKVVEGMDVIEQIKGVKTHTHQGHQDVPVEPIIITKAYKS